jgi:hypothetical protein
MSILEKDFEKNADKTVIADYHRSVDEFAFHYMRFAKMGHEADDNLICYVTHGLDPIGTMRQIKVANAFAVELYDGLIYITDPNRSGNPMFIYKYQEDELPSYVNIRSFNGSSSDMITGDRGPWVSPEYLPTIYLIDCNERLSVAGCNCIHVSLYNN